MAASHDYPDDHAMERPSETEEGWASQADQVVAIAASPTITGAYVWRGRADRSTTLPSMGAPSRRGPDDRPGLKVRVTPLGPDLKPLLGLVGPWQRLGNLSAEAWWTPTQAELFKPSCLRVDLSWRGGERATSHQISFSYHSHAVSPRAKPSY